jgi:hypothetical protein
MAVLGWAKKMRSKNKKARLKRDHPQIIRCENLPIVLALNHRVTVVHPSYDIFDVITKQRDAQKIGGLDK